MKIPLLPYLRFSSVPRPLRTSLSHLGPEHFQLSDRMLSELGLALRTYLLVPKRMLYCAETSQTPPLVHPLSTPFILGSERTGWSIQSSNPGGRSRLGGADNLDVTVHDTRMSHGRVPLTEVETHHQESCLGAVPFRHQERCTRTAFFTPARNATPRLYSRW